MHGEEVRVLSRVVSVSRRQGHESDGAASESFQPCPGGHIYCRTNSIT